MSITLAIAVYFVIWWTVLFAVLPIGVRTQGEDGVIVPGTPESAPTAPRLLRVVLSHHGDLDGAVPAAVGRDALRPRRSAGLGGTQRCRGRS